MTDCHEYTWIKIQGGELIYAVFSVSKFCLSTMSQSSGTSGMEDHSQNDPATRDQDEVSGRAAAARSSGCSYNVCSIEAVGREWHYGYHWKR